MIGVGGSLTVTFVDHRMFQKLSPWTGAGVPKAVRLTKSGEAPGWQGA